MDDRARYAPGDVVSIHYHRPPDRLDVFQQPVVEDDGECVVTYLPAAAIAKPMEVTGQVLLEPGSPIVWFTWRGDVWHDVGLFHRADGTFTGFYTNILTPVRMDGTRWDTTDLFLDVWIGAGGELQLLDRPEFHHAYGAGWIEFDVARRAGVEMQNLLHRARHGVWPPQIVREWTLERVRAAAGVRATSGGG